MKQSTNCGWWYFETACLVYLSCFCLASLCDFCGSSLLTVSKRLESQMRSAEQPGVVTTFRRNNFEPPYRHRKGASRNFFMHVFFKQLPTIRYATTNHDHFGVEQIHEVGQTNAEITSH